MKNKKYAIFLSEFPNGVSEFITKKDETALYFNRNASVANISESKYYTNHICSLPNISEYWIKLKEIEKEISRCIRVDNPIGLGGEYLFKIQSLIHVILEFTVLIITTLKTSNSIRLITSTEFDEADSCGNRLCLNDLIRISLKVVRGYSGPVAESNISITKVDVSKNCYLSENFLQYVEDYAPKLPILKINYPIRKNKVVIYATHARYFAQIIKDHKLLRFSPSSSCLLHNKKSWLWASEEEFRSLARLHCSYTYEMTEEINVPTTIDYDYALKNINDLIDSFSDNYKTHFGSIFFLEIKAIIPTLVRMFEANIHVASQFLKVSRTETLHSTDSFNPLLAAFDRANTSKNHNINLLPHSLTTASYQMNLQSTPMIPSYFIPQAGKKVSSLVGTFPIDYKLPEAKYLQIPYKHNRIKKLVRYGLTEDVMSYKQKRSQLNYSIQPLKLSIYLSSEIEELNIVNDPFELKKILTNIAYFFVDLGIAVELNIFPKTVFNTAKGLGLLLDNLNNICPTKFHEPSHKGIDIPIAVQMDASICLFDGSANIELCCLGIPLIKLFGNEFSSSSPFIFNYTHTDLPYINITLNKEKDKDKFNRIFLYNNALSTQLFALKAFLQASF